MKYIALLLVLFPLVASAHVTDSSDLAIAAKDACMGDGTGPNIGACIDAINACGSLNSQHEFVDAQDATAPAALCVQGVLTRFGVSREPNRVKRPLHR